MTSQFPIVYLTAQVVDNIASHSLILLHNFFNKQQKKETFVIQIVNHKVAWFVLNRLQWEEIFVLDRINWEEISLRNGTLNRFLKIFCGFIHLFALDDECFHSHFDWYLQINIDLQIYHIAMTVHALFNDFNTDIQYVTAGNSWNISNKYQ